MKRTQGTVGAESAYAHASTASRARTRLLGRLTILALAFPAIGLGTYWTSSHAPSPTRSLPQVLSYRSSQSSDGSGRGHSSNVLSKDFAVSRAWQMMKSSNGAGPLTVSSVGSPSPSGSPSVAPPTLDVALGLTVTKYQQWTRVVFEEEVAAQAAAIASEYVPAPSAVPVSSAGTTGDYSIAQWALVSECENGPGAWNPPRGPAYPDSLGIDAANWQQFGGGSDLSPAAQTAVGNRLLAAYGASIPDQNGCDSGGY